MNARPKSTEQYLAEAIEQVNAGHAVAAKATCLEALAACPPHAGLHQFMAVLCLRDGAAQEASNHIAQSLSLRPDHPPALLVAGDAARAVGDLTAALAQHLRANALMPGRPDASFSLGLTLRANGLLGDAAQALERTVALAPGHVQAWFELALIRQDLGHLDGAVEALRHVLRLAPQRAEAAVNLGIVLQEQGKMDDAMRAYGHAYRLQEDSFGRIAHALAAPSSGRLWLDLEALRHTLRGA